MSNQVFRPSSPGILIAVTDVAGAGVRAGTPIAGGVQQYRIVNHNLLTPTVVHIGYGDTVAAATANAVDGANGTAYTLAMMPNSVEVFTLAPGIYFSAIAGAGATSTVEITPGQGA